MSSEKRFRVEPRSPDGSFKVVDTKRSAYEGASPEVHPDVVCKALNKQKAEYISKCLNIYDSIGKSGPDIFVTNTKTFETIKTHNL